MVIGYVGYIGLVLFHLLVVYFLAKKMKNKNILLAVTALCLTVFTLLKISQNGFINNSNVYGFVNGPLSLLIIAMYIPVILGVYNKFKNRFLANNNFSETKSQVSTAAIISALVLVGIVFLALWQYIFLYWQFIR